MAGCCVLASWLGVSEWVSTQVSGCVSGWALKEEEEGEEEEGMRRNEDSSGEKIPTHVLFIFSQERTKKKRGGKFEK